MRVLQKVHGKLGEKKTWGGCLNSGVDIAWDIYIPHQEYLGLSLGSAPISAS